MTPRRRVIQIPGSNLPPEFRIGVTGHRLPPKLPTNSLEQIRATVGRILDKLFDLRISAIGAPSAPGAGHDPAQGNSIQIVIVSSLAQGADQIVAEEGLARGGVVDAVLPFPPGEYRRDFVGKEACARFESLLSRCRSTVALDYSRPAAARAYEAAGLQMLAESNVLIAIWDENEASGRGGTAHVVAQAMHDGVPVAVINPATPGSITIEWVDRGEQHASPPDPVADLARTAAGLLAAL